MAKAKTSKRGAKARSPEKRPGGTSHTLPPQDWHAFLYVMAPLERIALVREGVPSRTVGRLAHDMGIPKDKLYATLGVPRATMERKVRTNQRLSQVEGERVVGVARLVGQVEQMVGKAKQVEGFDAARWVAEWLDRPLPALGGLRPATLMDAAEGREIVAGLVAQMESAAYA